MLDVSQLNQYYGGSHILWDIELSVPELGGPASRYATFRRDADGARKDVLSWGESPRAADPMSCSRSTVRASRATGSSTR